MSQWFSKRLLSWWVIHGRHDLPWKKPSNAYRVWVSEIMLQQTQVSTVIPYFEKFMKIFPNIGVLANAPLDKVLLLWAGLGYYTRARCLHQTAKIVVAQYQGKFPRTLEALQSLPGIGRSTAGAILAQAFNLSAPILDGNVKRVLARFHCVEGWPGQKKVEDRLWELAAEYTPSQEVASYTQAIMDLGAMCCTRLKPNCQCCPLHMRCEAFVRDLQSTYPHKREKKSIPTHQTMMLLLKRQDGALLLEQRPLKGIWGGLWSFPEFQEEVQIALFLQNQFKVTHFKLEALPPLKHTFTHFHLRIMPRLVILPKVASSLLSHTLCWVKTKELSQKGVPAPVKKLIKVISEKVE